MQKLAHGFVSPHDHDQHSSSRKFSHDIVVLAPFGGMSMREAHAK
jgi:hypothetical protein